MKDFSFDIVSKADMMEVRNAIEQAASTKDMSG